MEIVDIIVIGAGTAGLSAGIYARRANKSVCVFEADTVGGQIINTLDIENYPSQKNISGFDFVTNLTEQAKSLGVEIVNEKVCDLVLDGNFVKVVTNKGEYKSKTVIVATGCSVRKLGIENEDSLIGLGVSYCATCDGAFYRKKDVAVVGGGNTAIEDALFLSNLANKVYLIHRRDEFRADAKDVENILNKDNVEIIYNSNVTKLNKDEKLESIDVTDNNGNVRNVKINGLFVAIGRNPENRNFTSIVSVDENGYIIAGENCHTNIENIFVAGDNRTKELRQLVTAASDGAIAATEAVKYINNNKNSY